MDQLSLEKETAPAQLSSVEAQLRSAKEETLVKVEKIKELQSQLGSEDLVRVNMIAELEGDKLKIKTTKNEVDAMVAIYRADALAA